MNRLQRLLNVALVTACGCAGTVVCQTSTASASGVVIDQHEAVVSGATVALKNVATGFKVSAVTDGEGRYRFVNIPIGTYELTAELLNFAKYEQQGITLNAGQEASFPITLRPDKIDEAVPVFQDASILNSTTAEVSTSFDSRRISGLPIASNRSAYGLLLSAVGVIPLAPGQTAFAVQISLSANGGRIRSNSFLLDGQDINDPALTGAQIPLNNPDAVQEVRIVTNQFLPEYGTHAGSIANFITKYGTNDFHGSLFWFHNNEYFNTCSNTDKLAGFCDPTAAVNIKSKAPTRRENHFGFTIGGPVILPRLGESGSTFYRAKDRTFFFADYQRWSDRRSPSITLKGAPTQAGRDALQQHAGDLPHVRALLQFVPPAMPNPHLQPVTVTITEGSTFAVERGDLIATSAFRFDSDQGSLRIDHLFNERNLLYVRYRFSHESNSGAGQIAPPGFRTTETRDAHAAAAVWTYSPSSVVSNEARIAWKAVDLQRDAEDLFSKSIPAIQINELGMVGDRESERRTALGLATNVPIIRANGTYQLSDGISITRGNHSFKFGADLKLDNEKLLFADDRGSLVYRTLSNFVNDMAESGSRALRLPGGDKVADLRWHEFSFYAQDKWKILPSMTLTYGIRYEYPGDAFGYLRNVNRRILVANGDYPAFRFAPDPKPDSNNWMPRIGFIWNPTTNGKGVLGLLTGGAKLVIRGGYARAYDAIFINTHQNIYGSFPFRATQSFAGLNGFQNLMATTSPNLSDVRRFSRVTVPANFRSPVMDQFSLDIQRELHSDLVLRIGYVRTRGTDLFQTIDGNPRGPCPFGTGPETCNTTGIDRNTGVPLPSTDPILESRIDPSKGIVLIRANSASSTYDALQASLEKRFGQGLGFGVYYTWSSLIDTASDVINLSVAEVAIAQDPFNLRAERARSGFDRPHRLSGNIVYELPFFSNQKGLVGKLLGGWQINSLFNLQSGAPFTVLNGSDPAGVGNGSIRPNIFTDLDLSGMSVPELYRLELQLRAQAHAGAREIFNLMFQHPMRSRCVAGWLSGPALPFTLFSAARGRVVCDAQGQPSLRVDFDGILEGQRVGNAGRNIIRADSFKNVDIGVIKNTQVSEKVRAQLWFDFFNVFNWRNFGIPSAAINDPGFLNQWTTDGGSRRVRLGARLIF